MPSRLGVVAILLFWAATAGLVIDREVVPRYFSDGPPEARIDLVDEATTQTETKWSLYRDVDGVPDKIGGLSTEMKYDPADDSFDYKNEYRDLRFPLPVAGVTLACPKAVANVRISRAGRLREQHMEGTLVVRVGDGKAMNLTLGKPLAAALHGRVTNGVLNGTVAVRTVPDPPTGGGGPAPANTLFEGPLEAVPVPDGQVLNPLMPVNRLYGVRPGRRWVIRELDPLQAAVTAAAREMAKAYHLPVGLPGAGAGGRELVAEVRPLAETLTPILPPGAQMPGVPPAPVECWVIDYRGDGVVATTWVAVSDGRVLRQQAGGFGERLTIERDY